MTQILSSIAINLDRQILQAALPLLAAEKVQAIEWSFDTLFNTPDIPPWFPELLSEFGKADRLIGHGVFFSLFSGSWSSDQEKWLEHLKKMCTNFRFDHITEHFGFMTGADFHKGAPLSIPLTAATLALGQDRLQRIAHTCECPVGLENLAFAYSLEEVKQQGAFLDQLLEPINGFIILDLHNVYCQLKNFDLEFTELLRLYPLDRVREIHISGGSWANSTTQPARQVRRDTHDDQVPEEVFQLLIQTLPQCPQLKYVVLEQLGVGLKSPESQQRFQQDFFRMDEIVQANQPHTASPGPHPFLPNLQPLAPQPAADLNLHQQQATLSTILETTPTVEDAFAQLKTSPLHQSDWQVEKWTPYMLETAIRIAQKWKDGLGGSA